MWNDGVSKVPRPSSVGRWYLGDPRGVGRRNGVHCSRLGLEGGGAEYAENESGK